MLSLTTAGTLALFALWGWQDLLPLVLVPALVGLAVGWCSHTRSESLLSGFAAGLVGTALSVWSYEPDRLVGAINSMPRWMNQDVTLGTYKMLAIPVWRAGAPLSAYVANTSHAPMLAAGAILLPVFALLANEVRVAGGARTSVRLVPWALSLLTAVCLVATITSHVSDEWWTFLDGPQQPGQYANDQSVNLRTNEIMREDGKSYYAAFVDALSQETSSTVEVADGKFTSSFSAALIRQPTMVYLWHAVTAVAPGRAIGWLSLALAAAMIPLSYWGLRHAVGHRALFVGFILFPGLVLWSSTTGALLPEWWASLCLLASFFALVRGKLLTALVIGFLAVLFRETLGLWLLCFIVAALLLSYRDRRWLRTAALSAGLLGAAAIAFLIHIRAGSAYFVNPANASGLASYVGNRTARSFANRSLAPLSYLLFPYGLNSFSPLFLIPVGLLGLWIGLVRTPFARLVATGYVAAVVAFMLLVGATATYWGQIVNPLTVIGATLFVLSLDRVASAKTWRYAPPDEAPSIWRSRED